MHRPNPGSLRSCPCIRVFRFNFASDFFNLLLVRFHQAETLGLCFALSFLANLFNNLSCILHRKFPICFALSFLGNL